MLVNTVFICQTIMFSEKLSVGARFTKTLSLFLYFCSQLLITFFKKKRVHVTHIVAEPLTKFIQI